MDRLSFDATALDRYLAGHLDGYEGPAVVTRFNSGQSNPTYRIETSSTTYVLRRKPPGALLPSAHRIDREYRVMAALDAAGFPVPAMSLYCDDPHVIGTEFYLMELVEGRVLFDTGLPGLEPAERTATYHSLIDTLADLHAIDFNAAGLSDFGRTGGYIVRQTRRWAEQYRATETHNIPAMDRLIALLPGRVAAIPDETCLVHGDYRLDNVMLALDAPRVAAVLDWELSTLGHPLADLGYFLMTWTFPAGLRYGLADTDLDALGIPSMTDMASRYAARTGRGEIAGLDLLLGYNIFRIAAILQGVYHRGLQGNASSDGAVTMGKDVPRLAEIALAAIEN